jgi:hypothetical protein
LTQSALRRRTRRFAWLVFLPVLSVLLVLVVAPAASSGPTTKNYAAALVPASAISSGDPATIRITNLTSSTQALGSANVTFSGFTPAQGPVPNGNVLVSNAAKIWSATVVGNTIQLRNPGPNNLNALAPGEYVQVSVAGPTAPGTYPLTTEAKQSNDFNGTGNNFVNSGTDPTLVVRGLDHFVWTSQPATPQQAGVSFSAQVTAYDSSNRVLTGYTGSGASLSGLGTSPRGDAPAYALTWSNGVGTATLTDYRAETTRVTIADGAVAQASSPFTVVAGAPASLTFSNQPSLTAAAQPINASSGGVKVQVRDAFGNLVDGASVTLALDASSPTGGTLSGATTQVSSGGTATFGNLSIATPNVGYVLRATSGAASTTSNRFVIANSTTTCSGGSCSSSATLQKNTTLDVNASGTTSGTQLGITLLLATAPPAGACPGFVPATGAPGSYLTVMRTSGEQPSFVVTWQLDKSIVNQQPENGVAHYNVCLGAVNLAGGTTGFTTKYGTAAVGIYDPAFGQTFYWGILQDCQAAGPTDPCVASRTKSNAGDALITFKIPYPWDANGWLG